MQETIASRATLRCGERCGLRAGAGAGRIDHQRIEAGEFGARERRALQIPALGGDAVGKPGPTSCLFERPEHGRVALDRVHRASGRGERQAERAAAGEQISDARGVADRAQGGIPDRGFGGPGRLQERAGRQLDRYLAEPS